VFAEPDHDAPDDDRALADAIARSGRVVLPVMVEGSEPGGTPIEVLPMQAVADAAAALGHAAVDTDVDGIVRSAYLRAGLGDPHWPALAATLYASEPGSHAGKALPGLRNPDPQAVSPYLWNRDDRVLVPYASIADFQQISFIDVMRGEVPQALLRDRLLLVGVTAKGIGDSIPTPRS